MKHHLMISMVACLSFLTTAHAQQKNRANAALSVKGKSSDSIEVCRLNVGVAGNADTLHGLQLNALFSTTTRKMQGIQLSGVASLAKDTKGAQVAAFSNISTTSLKGIQLAGVSNISLGVRRGIQWAGIANVCSDYMRGVQMAAYNYADTLNGSQVGIINVCQNHPRGVQIGIINYSRDTIAHKIGLVNVNPNTRTDLLTYGGNSTKVNVALRFRNRSTYNIIGFGTHYMGLDEKFSGALFYRIGQYFQLSPRWSVSGDVGYYHIETFQEHSKDKPERLYSLQMRLNADYQVSDNLGLFATVGYGDTRHYYHSQRYRHRPIVEAGLSVFYNRKGTGLFDRFPSVTHKRKEGAPLSLDNPLEQPKRPWRAALEATGINLLVHSFDRWVMNEEFAQVNLHTIHNNLKNGFVWDNDQFSTNLFAHPYHGNLYFNSARANGLTFYESMPYAFCGSLMWEMCGEIEPPAINDLIATTMGGICIGEVTHRISRLVLNDRSRGMRRFLREFAATAINPMGGLNRIIRGDAWRVRSENYRYHDYERLPIDFSLSVGNRYLADDGGLFRGESNPYVNLFLEYGDPFNEKENRPYDFFYAEATFGLSSNQPIINSLHLLGRIWGAPVYTGTNIEAEFGIYQHFNYYDSKPVKDGTDLTPYRISEAGSVGPGIIYRLAQVGALTRLEQRIFLSGILLGGTKSDYYNVIDRDYNMGSGYSVKSKTHLEFRNFGRFILHVNYFRIFTWKGYEQKDLSTIDPLYLNAQGDKGDAELLVINPLWEIDFRGPLSAILSSSYYARSTHYKYYEDVRARTFELRFGLTWHF